MFEIVWSECLHLVISGHKVGPERKRAYHTSRFCSNRREKAKGIKESDKVTFCKGGNCQGNHRLKCQPLTSPILSKPHLFFVQRFTLESSPAKHLLLCNTVASMTVRLNICQLLYKRIILVSNSLQMLSK